jgi:outer membrane protein assembly factor BamA
MPKTMRIALAAKTGAWVFCLLVLLGQPSFAETSQAQAITSISIAGLKRTRKQVAERPLEKYIGTAAADLDTNEVTATLLEMGIFEEIKVETIPSKDGSGSVLSVTLRERWSIFPLPLFIATSEGITGGLALIDANAFGLNDKLYAVGMLFPGGWMSMLAYMSTPDTSDDWRWSLSGSYSRQDTKDSDAYGSNLRRYGHDSMGAGLSLGKSVATNVSLSLSLGYKDKAIRTIDNQLRPPESSRHITASGDLGWRTSTWDGSFLNQSSIGLGYGYNFALLDRSYQTLSLRAAYERSLFSGMKLGIKGSALYDGEAPAAYENSAERVGVTLLPPSFSVRSLAGASIGVEARIVKFPFGVLAALASYQGLVSESPLFDARIDHGPAGGIRLYVARLAIPAMDIGVAYNIPTGLFKATFGIGARM